jgi:putative membrane protein
MRLVEHGERMAHLLTTAETATVAEHVARAERATAGEIVVVLAERSAGYERPRVAASFTATLLVAIALYTFVPTLSELWVLCAEAPIMAAFWWFTGLSAVTRWLVPAQAQRAAVLARAEQSFLEHGVTETRDRSGVLLFLSEAERRVELLADRGIHERVGTEDWQTLVNDVVKAIREGRAAAGIAGAVDAIGARLAQHFPPRPDDLNELADEPRHI